MTGPHHDHVEIIRRARHRRSMDIRTMTRDRRPMINRPLTPPVDPNRAAISLSAFHPRRDGLASPGGPYRRPLAGANLINSSSPLGWSRFDARGEAVMAEARKNEVTFKGN